VIVLLVCAIHYRQTYVRISCLSVRIYSDVFCDPKEGTDLGWYVIGRFTPKNARRNLVVTRFCFFAPCCCTDRVSKEEVLHRKKNGGISYMQQKEERVVGFVTIRVRTVVCNSDIQLFVCIFPDIYSLQLYTPKVI
jgi:hypothetical protein